MANWACHSCGERPTDQGFEQDSENAIVAHAVQRVDTNERRTRNGSVKTVIERFVN